MRYVPIAVPQFIRGTFVAVLSSCSPARADVALGERVADGPRTLAVEGHSDSPVIREARSDGGYWYWLERQPADGGIGGH